VPPVGSDSDYPVAYAGWEGAAKMPAAGEKSKKSPRIEKWGFQGGMGICSLSLECGVGDRRGMQSGAAAALCQSHGAIGVSENGNTKY
jgi:hypothetical protein